MKKLIYVAGKYTGKTYSEIDDNIKKAEVLSIQLIQCGWAVITPHKNTAHYEIYEKTAGIDYNTWIEISKTLLSKCDAIIMMKDWQYSTGSKIEHEYAEKLPIVILYEDDYDSNENLPGPDDFLYLGEVERGILMKINDKEK